MAHDAGRDTRPYPEAPMTILAADDYPLANLFWTFLAFFALMIYFWLLITVFTDLFRRDLSWVAKTAWIVLLIVLPMIGALAYLITQGRSHGRPGERPRSRRPGARRRLHPLRGGPGSQ